MSLANLSDDIAFNLIKLLSYQDIIKLNMTRRKRILETGYH